MFSITVVENGTELHRAIVADIIDPWDALWRHAEHLGARYEQHIVMKMYAESARQRRDENRSTRRRPFQRHSQGFFDGGRR